MCIIYACVCTALRVYCIVPVVSWRAWRVICVTQCIVYCVLCVVCIAFYVLSTVVCIRCCALCGLRYVQYMLCIPTCVLLRMYIICRLCVHVIHMVYCNIACTTWHMHNQRNATHCTMHTSQTSNNPPPPFTTIQYTIHSKQNAYITHTIQYTIRI